MEIKWLAGPRAVVVSEGDASTEVPLEEGATVTLPEAVAMSLIEQGLAEPAHPKSKKKES